MSGSPEIIYDPRISSLDETTESLQKIGAQRTESKVLCLVFARVNFVVDKFDLKNMPQHEYRKFGIDDVLPTSNLDGHHQTQQRSDRNEYIQLKLREIRFGEETFTIDMNGGQQPSFHYRYMARKISVAMNQKMGRLYIPIAAVDFINKVGRDTLSITLNSQQKNLIQILVVETLGIVAEITKWIENATTITFVANEHIPEQRLEMIWLHIRYILQIRINMKENPNATSKCRRCNAPIFENSSEDENTDILSSKNVEPKNLESFLVNLHFNFSLNTNSFDDEGATFEVPFSMSWNEFKLAIQDSCQIRDITEFTCKFPFAHNIFEYFPIRNEKDWNNALELLSHSVDPSPQLLLELWLMDQVIAFEIKVSDDYFPI
ncbi:hypothetical protein G9A89_003512 [Geosiphon pyriformis]|nr:hypothetical protein G9A89_003512 [Geosiphon pyriformis]